MTTVFQIYDLVYRMDIQYRVGVYPRLCLSNLAPNPWNSQRIENSEQTEDPSLTSTLSYQQNLSLNKHRIETWKN